MGSSSSEECFKFLRLFVVLCLVLLGKASVGGCIRPMNKDASTSFGQYLWNIQQLPRGPVPPSGPSPCHNKLDPYTQSQFSFSNDYVMCP
ncbi:hypothetical protein PTKIN_Ptkin17bG0110200 [Pterospermum kingtungense]